MKPLAANTKIGLDADGQPMPYQPDSETPGNAVARLKSQGHTHADATAHVFGKKALPKIAALQKAHEAKKALADIAQNPAPQGAPAMDQSGAPSDGSAIDDTMNQ